MAPRTAVHIRPSPRRLLRSSPRGGGLLRQHHVPRWRPPPRIDRRKHVHSATRLDSSFNSLLLRTARQRSHHLHRDGTRRLRQLTPRRRHARLHYWPRRNGHQHGPLVADPRLFQPSARFRSSSCCSCRRLPDFQFQCVELVVDLGRVGGSYDWRSSRGADVRSLHFQRRGEPCQFFFWTLAK